MLRRIEVQAHDIHEFLDEPWNVRNLERLDAMRLEAVVPPHPLEGVLAHTDRGGCACSHCTMAERFVRPHSTPPMAAASMSDES